MSTRSSRANNQYQRRSHRGGHDHPSARTAHTNISAVSTTSATSKPTNTNMRSAGHSRTPFLTNTSFFATTPTPQFLGFSTTAEAIATNTAVAVGVQDPEPRFVHSAMYEEAMRPLLPGQNLFESLDPERDSMRFANILGGWVRDLGEENTGKFHGERGSVVVRGNGEVGGEGRKREGQGKKRGRGPSLGRGGGGGGGGGGGVGRRKGGGASGRGLKERSGTR